MKTEPREGRLRGLMAAGSLLTVGLTLALSVAIGVMGGWALDQWLETRWFVIVGALLGIAAGFKQLFRTVAQAGRLQDEFERQERARKAGGE